MTDFMSKKVLDTRQIHYNKEYGEVKHVCESQHLFFDLEKESRWIPKDENKNSQVESKLITQCPKKKKTNRQPKAQKNKSRTED